MEYYIIELNLLNKCIYLLWNSEYEEIFYVMDNHVAIFDSLESLHNYVNKHNLKVDSELARSEPYAYMDKLHQHVYGRPLAVDILNFWNLISDLAITSGKVFVGEDESLDDLYDSLYKIYIGEIQGKSIKKFFKVYHSKLEYVMKDALEIIYLIIKIARGEIDYAYANSKYQKEHIKIKIESVSKKKIKIKMENTGDRDYKCERKFALENYKKGKWKKVKFEKPVINYKDMIILSAKSRETAIIKWKDYYNHKLKKGKYKFIHYHIGTKKFKVK